MSIEILSAQLANQIAAGEVVERPASVIKELIENSIDAGATAIKIQIEKGGAKRIKISDNGKGIPKEQLILALSRHATSKIKTLNDLERINSLGFRGEALASISSVSRLTLTSKPVDQTLAWQASAEGRDMQVDITPAAHPNGTSIDVQDLFFNTPARRKFLRTDKTEFTHIEEVIKRIALACMNVSFVLLHNDKIIKQYQAASTKAQCTKRVAQICGQKFVDHAIEVECQHDDLHFSGWLAKPSFAKSQNDLCYSYVNGRMMRDKLINHAIRQAYSDLLPPDTYPAFVLFLTLNNHDVDVNVHPAKHEVRFHQSRYIHDFIFSVCQKSLQDATPTLFESNLSEDITEQVSVALPNESFANTANPHGDKADNVFYNQPPQKNHDDSAYIKPLTHINDAEKSVYQAGALHHSSPNPSAKAQNAYYQLMSHTDKTAEVSNPSQSHKLANVHDSINSVIADISILHIVQSSFALIELNKELKLLSLTALESEILTQEIKGKLEKGLISQPLLLPVKIDLTASQMVFIEKNKADFDRLGIVYKTTTNHAVHIREFPALLRHRDVAKSFAAILNQSINIEVLDEMHWLNTLSLLLKHSQFNNNQVLDLLTRLKKLTPTDIQKHITENSVKVDLESAISELMLLNDQNSSTLNTH